MFDQPTTICPAWARSAQPGHVVLFHFPTPIEPGPVLARPCLVLETPAVGIDVRLTLALGTPNIHQVRTGPHVYVRAPKELDSAGLQGRTWFDCYRILSVSVHNASFTNDQDATSPIVGCLSGGSFKQMQRVRDHLQTQREIAALSRREGALDLLMNREPTVVPSPKQD
jgi:hypothetical protein